MARQRGLLDVLLHESRQAERLSARAQREAEKGYRAAEREAKATQKSAMEVEVERRNAKIAADATHCDRSVSRWPTRRRT